MRESEYDLLSSMSNVIAALLWLFEGAVGDGTDVASVEVRIEVSKDRKRHNALTVTYKDGYKQGVSEDVNTYVASFSPAATP